MNSEFLEAVRQLVEGVHGFLDSDDGNDNHFIELMSGSVHDVLKRAQEVPALQDWAKSQLADQEEKTA